MSDFKDHAISLIGVDLERDQALFDVQGQCREVGESIEFRIQTESTITRDPYNSISKKSTTGTKITLWAYPLIFSPTDKDMDRAGIKERTEVIAYTPMLTWNQAGYTMQRLETIDGIRANVIVKDVQYEIKEKNLHSHFHDTYLYIVLGLNKI